MTGLAGSRVGLGRVSPSRESKRPRGEEERGEKAREKERDGWIDGGKRKSLCGI